MGPRALMQINTNILAVGKFATMRAATVADPENSGQLPLSVAGDGFGVAAAHTRGADDALHLLDDPQEWAAFSHPDAHNPELVESNLVVDGITCSACAITIEQALRTVCPPPCAR